MNRPAATPPAERTPHPTAPPLRVLYFGTYRAAYSRNRIQIEGLRRNGVEVVECHEPLWRGIEDRVQAVRGGWKRPAFWGRLLRTYARLLRRYWPLRAQYDLIVCGYPGQFDIPLAWLLSRLASKPLAWDIFMSTWLIATERGLDAGNRLVTGLLRRWEWAVLRLPDQLVIDTAAYAHWFEANHGVPAASMALVPTGADSDAFQPLPAPERPPAAPFTVLYYGSYIPNHGVPSIVAAARHLRDDPDIRFVLIGDGPERARAEAEAQRLALMNVEFLPWMAQPDLIRRVAAADLCLGAFGTTPQSLMTVQNKIYEGLALGKPVLTGDSAAVRQALRVGDEIFVCARADGTALAQAIRTLRDAPERLRRVAAQGRARFCADYTIERLGERYAAILRPLAERQKTQRAARR